MKNLFLLVLFFFPALSNAQTEVGSEPGKLLVIILIILALPLVFFLLSKLRKEKAASTKNRSLFSFGRLKVELQKDRKYRPRTLTLRVKNNKRKDVDVQAPVLMFRKLWSVRKFKLKGMDRSVIYPLYLEAGKIHELRINLGVFHEHDRSLASYYWAKVIVHDTHGRKYTSRYITLRKSLFS